MTFADLLDHEADVYRLAESVGATYRETRKRYAVAEGGANLACTFTRRDTSQGDLGAGIRPVGDRSMYFETGFEFADRDVVKVKSGPTGFQGPQLLLVESFATPRGHHVELRVTEFEGELPQIGTTSVEIEGAPTDLVGKALAMSDSGAILFGCENDAAVYRSVDDGQSFDFVTNLEAGGRITNLIQLAGGGLLAFVRTDATQYRSTDDGLTWSAETGPAGTYPREGAVVELSDGRLVVGCHDGTVFTSDDSGASWDDRGVPGSASRIYSLGVAANGNVVAGSNEAGGARIYYSTDSGETWAAATLPAGYPSDAGAAGMGSVHSIERAADGSLVATGGISNNVWRSTDNGATWTEIAAGGDPNGGLNLTIYRVSSTGTLLTMGTSDGGFVKVRRSTDDGATWDPAQSVVGDDPTAPPGPWLQTTGSENGREFLETQGGAVLACLTGEEPLWRSVDDGESWENPG